MTDQLAIAGFAVAVITALGGVPAIVAFIKSWSDRGEILDEIREVTNTAAGAVDLLSASRMDLVTQIIDLETRARTAESRAMECETRLRQLGGGLS